MPQRSKQPSLLRIGILALLCCAVTGIPTAPAFGAAEAEEAASENASEQVFLPLNPWGPHAESTLYGFSYIEEDEPDGTRLQGISLLWSSWDETVDFSGGLGVWLSAQTGDSQTVIGAGAEVTLYPWVFQAPVRFGPRFRLGVEHRRRDPDDGFGGLFAIGVEGAIWIGGSFQIALTIDREMSFPAEDRTQFGLSFRLARPRY